MTKLAEVHTLYEVNASDIAAMLRQAADKIESGEAGEVRQITAVAEHEGGAVSVYGWGRTDTPRSIATLHLGAAKLIKEHLEGAEE